MIRIAMLFATVSIAACGGKGGGPEMPPVSVFPAPGSPPSTAVKEAGANAQVLLMKPKVGDADDMQASVKISGSASAAGESMDIDMKMDFTTTATIAEVKPDGGFTMKSTIKQADVKVGGAMGQQLGGDMSRLNKMMEGMTTAIVADARGRMLELNIEGDNPMGGAGMGLDKTFQSGFVPFPEEAVGVGGSWDSYGYVETMGIKARLVGNYKLVELNGSVATIDLRLRAEGDPGPGNFMGSPVQMQVDEFVLTGGGRMKVDLERPTHGEMQLELDANAKMSARGETAKMSMNMKMDAGAPK